MTRAPTDAEVDALIERAPLAYGGWAVEAAAMLRALRPVAAVPRDPTEAMTQAAFDLFASEGWKTWNKWHGGYEANALWRAMYDAAPSPAAPRAEPCQHEWVTDGINNTQCRKCFQPAGLTDAWAATAPAGE